MVMQMMTRVALALALLGGAGDAKPAPGSHAIVDRPVALVGGSPIWKSEIDDTIRAAKVEPSPDIFQKVLDDLIDQHLMLQAAEAAHIAATDAEIDAGVQQVEQQNKMTDAALDTALAEISMTRAQFRAELAKQITINKLIQVEIVPKISVPANGNQIEFQMQLENERRTWLEARKRSVHIERRQ
jgi:peptidyl-prolyl cis-trans isomerase SurA